MTSPLVIVSLLLGVLLSAAAQIVLKMAMSSPKVQALLASGAPFAAGKLGAVLLSTPTLYLGLALYGLSMAVWLFVLSKVDVSFAYPFVGLGIVATTLAGYFVLSEPVGAMRIAGCLVVVLGIVMVAKS